MDGATYNYILCIVDLHRPPYGVIVSVQCSSLAATVEANVSSTLISEGNMLGAKTYVFRRFQTMSFVWRSKVMVAQTDFVIRLPRTH